MGNKKWFNDIDPYNPQNKVEGFISVGNENYGNIEITSVNGKKCNQIIHATPKFMYPGNTHSPKTMSFNNLPKFSHILLYDKLDGTNILMYRYKDAEGNDFISYKTRLKPFLTPSAWGDWKKIWDQMLIKYSGYFEDLMDNYTEYNFGFELYGFENEHLVKYNIALDTALLYAINRNTGKLVEPSSFPFHSQPKLVLKYYEGDDNIINFYQKMLNNLESEFTKSQTVEGLMLYLIDKENSTICAWKCKPPSVLNEQQEDNDGKIASIGNNDIKTTIINALENTTELLLEVVVAETIDLLDETYAPALVNENMDRIRKMAFRIISDLKLKEKVLQTFAEKISLPFTKENKNIIMKEMSKYFNKSEMTSVFNYLSQKYLENKKV